MPAPSPFEEKVRAGNAGRISVGLIALTFSLAALIFTIDLLVPLAVAGGVPYATVVLIGMWSRWRPLIYLLAGLGTVLTGLGYDFFPGRRRIMGGRGKSRARGLHNLGGGLHGAGAQTRGS